MSDAQIKLYKIRSTCKDQGGPPYALNTGSYMKASSTNYKPVFIELKKNIQHLRYCNFSEKFPIQTYGPKIFQGQFCKFKKSLKVYILLHFLN